MTRTTWIVFIVLCVGLLGGLILVSRGTQLNVDNVDVSKFQDATEQSGNIGDHIIGEPTAAVTIIEYGDFQCPACSTAAPVMKEVIDEYKDKGVAFIFRNFPLTTIHPNAIAAASAAEAAGLQGKYWEMYDKLYQNQSAWENAGSTDRTDVFVGYAASLALDTEQFKNDITSQAVAQKIDFDTALARKAEVQSTPTIFVNGELVSDTRVKDGMIAPSTERDAPFVWSSSEDFINLIIEPALKEAEANESS